MNHPFFGETINMMELSSARTGTHNPQNPEHRSHGEKKMLVTLENNRNMTQNGKRNETKEVCQKRQNIT